MPCMCPEDDTRDRVSELSKQVDMLAALACAALTVLEQNNLMDQIDWKEAGVKPKWASKWWADHKRKDKVRREREARETLRKEQKKEKEALRKATIEKLDPETRKILGL